MSPFKAKADLGLIKHGSGTYIWAFKVATISGLLDRISAVDFFKHFTLDETLTVIRNRRRLKSFVSSVNRSAMVSRREYQKRRKDFWSEFELYLADLLVGVVVDVALVGMLAPYARIWQSTVSSGLFGRIQHACASLPNRFHNGLADA
ncbi:hypothetical protein Q3G72_025627 [Acer saccharum]|nr:hypothetical protein Q3G72_025627 [Acer saccharum]